MIEHRGDFSKLDPMQLAMSTLSGALGGAVSAKLAAAGAKFLQTLIVNAISSGAIDGGLQLARNAVEGNELSKDVLQSFTTSAVGGALGEVGELGFKQLGRIAKEVAGQFMDFVRQVIRGNVDDFVAQGVKQLDIVDDVVRQVDETPSSVHLCATSFVAGTEILTPDGLVNIEDIEIGDWVLSDDPATPGGLIAKQVTRTFERTAHGNVFELNIDGEIIATTEEHPFWVVDQGWTSAHELEVGDFFLTDDGDLVDLDGISRRDSSFRVYNFEVEDFNTYFVSENGVLVHNMSCDPIEHAKFLESLGVDATKEHSDVATGSNVFEAFANARRMARERAVIGDNQASFLQTVGPQKNNLYSGMKSSDGSRGWRIDFDPDNSNKGFHINWWFRLGKKRRDGWYQGYIRVDGGTRNDYYQIANQFPRKEKFISSDIDY